MAGFEFTPEGIVPIGAARPIQEHGAVAGGVVQPTLVVLPEPSIPVAPIRVVPAAAKPSAPIKPADVVKLARKRLREVERELSRIRKLEKERDELRRLLDAADNKPRAVVRDISAAKRG